MSQSPQTRAILSLLVHNFTVMVLYKYYTYVHTCALIPHPSHPSSTTRIHSRPSLLPQRRSHQRPRAPCLTPPSTSPQYRYLVVGENPSPHIQLSQSHTYHAILCCTLQMSPIHTTNTTKTLQSAQPHHPISQTLLSDQSNPLSRPDPLNPLPPLPPLPSLPSPIALLSNIHSFSLHRAPSLQPRIVSDIPRWGLDRNTDYQSSSSSSAPAARPSPNGVIIVLEWMMA